MAVILKQSTQIKVRVGPFVDVGDGFTPEVGVTLSGADEAELLKANGVATVDISAATWAAVTGADGWYDLTLTTSHTDTVGELLVVVQDDSVCLPVYQRFQVLEESIYDALFAASAAGFDANQRVDVGSWLGTAVTTSATTAKPEVDVNSVSDDATAADNLELDYDGTGYAKGNSTIGTATTNTDMRGTDSAALASVCTEGRLAELDAANLPADVDTLLTRITSTLFSGITSLAEWLGLLAGKQTGDATARTEVRATGGGAGTFDETTDSNEAIRDTAPLGNAMRGTDSAALASVCTESRLAELDAANLPADVDSVLADTADMQPKLGTPAGADMSADIAAVKTDTAATLVDTGTTLPATLGTPAGADLATDIATVDTVVDAIKAITDAIGATAAANMALALGASGVVTGAAEAGTLSTTQMTTDLTEATDDHYIGRALIWTSGVLAGQATDITDYAGTNGRLTYTAVTEAPSATDAFMIV